MLTMIHEHTTRANRKIAALESEKQGLIREAQPKLAQINRELETAEGKRRQELMMNELKLSRMVSVRLLLLHRMLDALPP